MFWSLSRKLVHPGKGHARWAGKFSPHNKRLKKREVFKLLWGAWSHTSRGKRCAVVPGDLSSSVDHFERSAKMYRADPGLLVCSLRGKEAQWKDAFLARWARQQPKSLQATFTALQDVVASMSRPSCHAVSCIWQKHVNKNVTHHAGWLPLVQRCLPLFRQVPSKRSGVLVLGVERNFYKPLPFSPAFVKAYTSFRKIGEILGSIQPFRSCKEWCETMDRAASDATDQGLGRLTKLEYLWPWMLRSQMYCVLQSAGICRLTSKGLTIDMLSRMCPDMRKHVEDLAEHRGSAKELFRTVSYDGPPELFSMYCCIFLCGSHDQLDTKSKKNSKVEAHQVPREVCREVGPSSSPSDVVRRLGVSSGVVVKIASRVHPDAASAHQMHNVLQNRPHVGVTFPWFGQRLPKREGVASLLSVRLFYVERSHPGERISLHNLLVVFHVLRVGRLPQANQGYNGDSWNPRLSVDFFLAHRPARCVL